MKGALRAEADAPVARLGASTSGATRSVASDLAYLNGNASNVMEHFSDERLTTPISLEIASAPLSDLARRLRSATGVEIVIPEAVALHAVAVYCSEKPLADVMRQMARLLDIGWQTSEQAGRIVYRAVWEPRTARARQTPEDSPQSDVAAARTAVRKETDAALMGDPSLVAEYRAGRVPAKDAVRHEGWILCKPPPSTPK